MVWIRFILCVLIIFFAGRKVARYGDMIAEKTGLGGLWIGAVLVAWTTSLPELFTGIGSILVVGIPGLTIGNLFGASTFNLLNLALLDIAYRKGSLLAAVRPGHQLTAWCALALIFIAAASVFISTLYHPMGIGWIGWYTPIIVLLYLVFVREIFRFEQHQPQVTDQGASPDYAEIPLWRAYLYFALAAAFVVGAGIWLAIIGEEIAMVTGLEATFVGSLFLSFTTTLPEITVSFAAMRMGAVDLAVANMIGSNLLNMTIISINDLLYLPGPVLAAVSPTVLITCLTIILMSGIIIAGLRFRPRRFLRLSWCNSALIGLFLIGSYISFTLA